MPADNFDYSRPGGENVELLQALIDGATEYTKDTNSRNAAILKSIINNTEYTEPPQSEIEELLLELKAYIGGQIEVNELIADENGTYDAGLNKAFNPVTVAVPLDHKTITANGVYSASAEDLAGYDEVTVDVEGYQIKSLPNTPTSIATITDGTALPMPSLKVGINAYQSGSGDPSPTNIRPISGFSAVNRYRTGKNLFNIDAEHTASTTTYSYELKVKPNTAYTMSSNVPRDNPASLYFNGGTTKENGVWSGTSRTFTSDENGKFTAYVRYTDIQGGIDLYTAVKNGTYYIQLEEGNDDTEYEPFGTTYTTTLKDGQGNPLTCYGGELSNVNGVQSLTVDMGMVDLGKLTWEYAGSYGSATNVFKAYYVTKDNPSSTTYNAICEEYKVIANDSLYSGVDKSLSVCKSSADQYALIRVNDTTYTDAATFKTAMSGVKLVYELPTPQTIPQDNLAIASQDGTNNIFADSGEIIEGSYFAEL